MGTAGLRKTWAEIIRGRSIDDDDDDDDDSDDVTH
jgi:hypothetical protein